MFTKYSNFKIILSDTVFKVGFCCYNRFCIFAAFHWPKIPVKQIECAFDYLLDFTNCVTNGNIEKMPKRKNICLYYHRQCSQA